MEIEEVNSEQPSLPFAYLGPNHPTLYFPDTARPALLFHRSLLRPHPVILSKTNKVAGASLELQVNKEPATATVVGKSPTCDVDQTQPNETSTKKSGVCSDDTRVELEKKNFVDSSSQTEWQLPPKENFLPVPLVRALRGTTNRQPATSSHVENNQSIPSVEGCGQESLDLQDKAEGPSEVKEVDNNDNVEASGSASPLLETVGNQGSEEKLEEEEVTNSGQNLVSPTHCVQKSNTTVGEESILPDIDNADVVMGILQEDIDQTNNIEDVLQQPTNNDILADLIAELNNGLCDENKNTKEVGNGGDRSPPVQMPADGSGGNDQLLKSGAAQQLVANETFGNVNAREGSSSNSTSDPTSTSQLPMTRVIRVPFPSRGVATDHIAISPLACLPLTAAKPLPRSNTIKAQVSLPSTVANYTPRNLVPVKRPLTDPGTNTAAPPAKTRSTLSGMTPKTLFETGGLDSCVVDNSKVPHGGSSDANLNTITISSDEEDSQVPGSLQEVGFEQ